MNSQSNMTVSIPSSVTTSPGRGIRLDQYQSRSPIQRHRKRIPSIKDADFAWYDLDGIATDAVSESTEKDLRSQGILEINEILDPLTSDSNHSTTSNKLVDRFLGSDQEKDDRAFRKQVQQLEREMSRTAR